MEDERAVADVRGREGGGRDEACEGQLDAGEAQEGD